MRQSALSPPKSTPRKTQSKTSELPEGAQPLFEQLNDWRREQARVQGVPAFVILQDRTLSEIARKRPQTLGALSGIYGIGEKKLERYGTELLNAVKAAD